jgi:hypothetical protein
MTKVVRAFSLDPSVSEDLDFYTRVPGVSKPMNKSKYVNEALQFYMGKNIKEMIEENKTLKENLTGGLRARDDAIKGLEGYISSLEAQIMTDREETGVIIQGLKHDLVDSLAKESPNCRCLWCRLKRRLQK